MKRDLYNLATDSADSSIDIRKSLEATAQPKSILDRDLTIDIDPMTDTNLVDDYLEIEDATVGMQYDKDLFKPKELDAFDPEAYDRWYLGKRMGKEDLGGFRNIANLAPKDTAEYAGQVGLGLTTSLLTQTIMGPDGDEGGVGQFVSYDKAEGPAGNYVSDMSRIYEANGGRPLTFNMYTNNQVPVYGPRLLTA